MVIGLALFSWDQKQGSVLDVKYPETLELADSLLNKVYMTHAYKENYEKEELIEINYKAQILLSYCDMTKVSTLGYEILVLIIHEKEKIYLYKLKLQLLDLAKKIFELSKEERKDFFLANIGIFFKKTSERKILLLGRAGTGKTSIKKIIFEGKDPKDLMYNPLEPTRGLTPSIYSWLDLQLGIFDSAGQELNILLNDENEQIRAFENTDVIIYLFDFPIWVSNSLNIINEIQKILDIIKKKSYNIKLILFLHKIDLMNNTSKEKDLEDIKHLIEKKLNLPLYFTSIYPNLIYSIYNAFYEILSEFSEETINIKEILDKKIKDLSKVMCYITDRNNSIIVQTMSNDFNTMLINHSHKLIAQLNQSFEDMSEEEIDHLIISSSKKLNIIMNHLELSKFNIKNLITISENLSANKLISLAGQIIASLTIYLYYKIKN